MHASSRETHERRLSPRIRAIVERLRGQPVLGSADLASALSGELGFDDVRAFVRFEADAYARTLVYRDERFELRLIAWRPGQSSSLHGHGASSCAFRVVRGTATEIVLGERDRAWPPESIVEERGHRVHQVMNLGPDPLLTLHAYSPPIPIDAPSPLHGEPVVVVGGGLAGAAAAFHLLERGGPRLRVHLVEKGPWIGRGVAYGVESALFRLNVPAARMSLDPRDPDAFVRYAGAHETPHAFLSRATYGRYVMASLAAAVAGSPGKLRIVRDEAIGVTERDVELRSGERLPADAVVLATGLQPRVARTGWSARIIDAWDECGLATLPRAGRLLVLGSGLSALDTLAWLDAQRFAGEVTLLSRRGVLPLPHSLEASRPIALSREEVDGAPRELRALVRWVRARLEASGGEPWQRTLDGLRPHVARLYRGLSPRDRARFVRHVRPYWDAVRHRAPPDALAVVERWETAGRLIRVAGRLERVTERASDLEVELRERTGAAQRAHFAAMVRCVGPAMSTAEAETPLLRALLDRGFARPTYGDLGIETDPEGRVVDRDGRSSPRLFALGSLRRASDWETTSVPDIAAHAAELAQRILKL